MSPNMNVATAAGGLVACSWLGGLAFTSSPPGQTSSSALRGGSSAHGRAAPTPSVGGIASTAAPVALAGLALAAAQRSRTTRSHKSNIVASAYDASQEVGALAPLNYWDPAGFMVNKDEATFLDYRAKELKHGRVAMMSIIGFLVQPFADSANIGIKGVGGGVEALYTYPASAGFGVLFILAGFFELKFLPELEESPGNYGDPLKFASTGNFGEYNEDWRNFELQNGRMAMIGSIGTIVASFQTGLDAYQQWGGAKAASIAFIKTTLPFAP